MVLHEFPNLQWLKAQAASRFGNRRGVGGIELKDPGWPSVILNTKAHSVVRDHIIGPLSIFTNLSGTSYVSTGANRAAVTPQTFFITNSQQPYTLELTNATTETFNIHFGDRFVKTALAGIFDSDESMLQSEDGGVQDFGFHNRLVYVSPEFQNIISAIQEQSDDTLFVDEKLFELLNLLVREQNKVRKIETRLPSVKGSTREEIIKRLFITTDYLYTFYNQNPSLDELAAVSCLSKFHFLRLFKTAFNETPHQFITRLKIEKAKTLLQKTRGDIHVVGAEVGFKDSSSFSRAFKSQVGVYPSHFRASRN